MMARYDDASATCRRRRGHRRPRCAPRPTRSSPRRPTTTAGSSGTALAVLPGRRPAPLRVLTALQHRAAGLRPVRDGARRRPGRPPRGPRVHVWVDETPARPAGRPAHRLGARPGRRAAHAHPGRGRRRRCIAGRRGRRRPRRRRTGSRPTATSRDKVGTYPLAVARARHRHPVLRLRPDDRRWTPRRRTAAAIADRGAAARARSSTSGGVADRARRARAVRNPRLDVTPAELITGDRHRGGRRSARRSGRRSPRSRGRRCAPRGDAGFAALLAQRAAAVGRPHGGRRRRGPRPPGAGRPARRTRRPRPDGHRRRRHARRRRRRAARPTARSCASSSSATGSSPRTRSATSRSASSRGRAGASRSTATSVVALALEYGGLTPAAAVRHGPRRRHRGDPARRHPAARRLRRRARPRRCPPSRSHYRVEPGPADGPDVGRPGALPAVPGRRPSGCCRSRSASSTGSTSSGFAVVAAVVARSPRASTTASASTAGSSPPPGPTSISREARLAVVGNVLTHVDYRGRGYATAVTGAVTAELLRYCDQVVLNVRSDNPPALQAYRRLGYAEHVRFEERLVHRLGSPWPDLTAPLRRLFDRRRERRPRSTAASGPPPTARRTPPGPMTDPARPRRDRPRPRRRGRPPDRVGRARDARPAPDPRAVRARAAARRPPHRRVPPRHDRDREPDADAQGRRRRGRTSRPRTRCRRKDDVAAALVAEYGIATYARRGEDRDTYYAPPQRGRRHAPADHDGRRLRPRLAAPQRAAATRCQEVLAGTEETTTGVIRLQAMAADGALGFPVVAVNEAQTKHLFDNRYGTGQSHARRHPAGDEHPHRRAQRRRRRLRLGRQGDRVADGRPRRPRRGRRGRPGPRPRGADGRLPGHDRRRGRRRGASCS